MKFPFMLGKKTLSRLIKKYSPTADKTGAPPGTLIHTGRRRTDQVTMEASWYNKSTSKKQQINGASELKTFRNEQPQDDGVLFVHVKGLHEVDKIRELGGLFGLHPLVMEDILHTEQRPKLENYETYLFMILPAYDYDEEAEEWVYEQISLVLGKGFVLMFQESDFGYLEPLYRRIEAEGSRVRERNSDYLTYAITDVLVDYFFGIIDVIEYRMEEMETKLLEQSDGDIQEQLYELRRQILHLRRSMRPLRELVQKMTHASSQLIHKNTRMYLRDLYDHVVLNLENLEHNREILMSMMDTYLASLSIRMNEVMKVLTIIATIFIPLSFITGIFGMNFNPEVSRYNMPELNYPYGYPIVMGFMLVVGLLMVVYFWRKDWY